MPSQDHRSLTELNNDAQRLQSSRKCLQLGYDRRIVLCQLLVEPFLADRRALGGVGRRDQPIWRGLGRDSPVLNGDDPSVDVPGPREDARLNQMATDL